jgi:hypothetical protein
MLEPDEWSYGAHILNLGAVDNGDRAFVVSTYDILGDGIDSILVRATVEPDVPEERRGVWIRLHVRAGEELELILNRQDARWLSEAIDEELTRLDAPLGENGE